MNDVINIYCLLWFGDFRGRDYNEKDVHRLYQSVSKHLKQPFNFYTLTNSKDLDVPGTCIMLRNNWPGWWSKVELFRRDLPKGRSLYFDLDSHIINDLEPILKTTGDLVMFDNVVPKWKEKRDSGLVCRYQAATMLFDPGALGWIYDKFKYKADEYMSQFRSEQDMYGAWIPNQPTFPSKWMLKMEQLRSGKVPAETIIITGQPKRTSFRDPDFAPWLDQRARGKEETV